MADHADTYEIQPLTSLDITITSIMLVFFMALTVILSMKFKALHPFFSMFTEYPWRVICTAITVVFVVAISMFYVEILGIILIITIFVGSLILLRLSYKGGQVKPASVTILVGLLCLLLLPMLLVAMFRQEMTPVTRATTIFFVVGFWLIGAFASQIPEFAEQVRPLSRTRPLLMYLIITMWINLYAFPSWGIVFNFTLALVSALVWWGARDKKNVRSLGKYGFRNLPVETAVSVMVAIFAVTLNLTLMIRPINKEKTENLETKYTPLPMFVLNCVLFGAVLVACIGLGLQKVVDIY
jgi:hypothetical protein